VGDFIFEKKLIFRHKLNRLQPEDRTVSVKFSENTVVIRGNSADVERAAKEIQRIAESAASGSIVYDSVRQSRPIIVHVELVSL